MTDKFQGKYRITSSRLQNWDYKWNAMYFVTICTQNRECYFGEITNGKMGLSDIGEIVECEWLKTFEMRPDMNLEMDEFVIMPNHFHAIICIGKNEYNMERGAACGTERGAACGTERRDAMHCVSTTKPKPNPNPTTQKNKFGPQSKNLASVIRGFKSAVTVKTRKINADFAWQPRFYDHIIRNAESFQRIRNYICENPLKWADDKFFE